MKKAFRITDGKGIQITFDNGYTVSIQFGWGNYCDHYKIDNWHEFDSKDSPIFAANGSNTAETSIIDPSGKFVQWQDYDVQGYQTSAEVIATLNYAASLPADALLAARGGA